MENEKSALGLDSNITALISYLIPLVGLILIFIEKDNKYVRFHAFQAVLWVVLCIVGIIAIMVVGGVLTIIVGQISEGLGTIVGLLVFLLYLAFLLVYIGGLIFGAVKGYGGNMFKFPLVGNMAEKWSN